MKKWMSIVAVVLCGLLLMAGCGGGSSSGSSGVVGSSVTDDGREIGGYGDGRMGDTLTNAFFSYCVNSAELVESFEGQAAPEGKVYLVADLTVKNVFGEEIPMFSDDFQVQWGEGDEDYGFPIPKFHDSQMDDDYEMKKGETVNKLCVYEVPVPAEKTEYSISYLELYDDDMEGNVFFVYFELEMPSAA